ncbi:alanine racemase [Clostridium ljungdahlii]|uniref:Alanine racemase n=1 Tax=Clostridium ljungdahlii (strain ATCC 55383 / DSM 13528 / PETC) TaxID=748727 RepID=D8GII9_CLOLD|nr:alanine racemase [Clostridium ljungdahlii]ADK17063.1 alanine racemase [Clostridium ljungdahlii DSM 13528]OAA85171.1 Alanine racemase [Clostridium ljungdahlii DSM 13528]
MLTNHRPVWVEVDLSIIASNMRSIRDVCKDKEIFGVVKADAYGHGAIDVAPVLLENGATRLAVALVSEGIELRKAGVTCQINVLGITPPNLFRELLEYELEPVVSDYDYAKALSESAAALNKTVRIHLKVDTGLGRIGFLTTEKAVDEAVMISKLPNIFIESIFSHFSSAGEANKEYSYKQFEKFQWFINKMEEKGLYIKLKHIANSSAIWNLPETYLDGVRPGTIIYGCSSDDVKREVIPIKPAMTWKANILFLKELEAGQYIGYGRKFRTERKSIIGTLGVGYADGYSRMLSGKAKVIINGKFAPVVGNICMDQCMVDLTDIGDVKLGDEVILMGSQGELKIDADDIAKLIGTNNNEVMCLIGRRVPRVYIKDGKVIKIKNNF